MRSYTEASSKPSEHVTIPWRWDGIEFTSIRAAMVREREEIVSSRYGVSPGQQGVVPFAVGVVPYQG